jgi:hypothetical protein
VEARRTEVGTGDPGDLQSNLGKIQGDTEIGWWDRKFKKIQKAPCKTKRSV